MKVHQLATREPSSSLCCKRPRPLVPKLSVSSSGLDQAENQPPAAPPTTMVEAHSAGTRWNPTREQIGILEMLYRGGMRTPNAHQIDSITAQLGKYGRIEGKNVFYWFQNHKARERQRQKRCSVGLSLSTGLPQRDSLTPDSGKNPAALWPGTGPSSTVTVLVGRREKTGSMKSTPHTKKGSGEVGATKSWRSRAEP